ncbi:MAG: response regulator transcription factor [Leptospira sp.]|nr:response regulator transcription factor [Leptospira sp.]
MVAVEKPIFDCVEDDQGFVSKMVTLLAPLAKHVRTFSNAEEYLNFGDINHTEILFVDIILPGINGIELTKIIREKHPDLKIVVLSAMDSDDILFQALKSGAIGYILKTEVENLTKLTQDILNGGAVISSTLALRVLKSFHEPHAIAKEGFETLTSREKDILNELISGQSLREVADELEISLHTVQTHTKNIYKKLQVNNRIQLLKRASDLGFN